MIEVVIPGDPVAQGRGRAVRTPAGCRIVDPPKSRSWKAVAQSWMVEAAPAKPLDGPLRLVIEADWTMPKTRWRKRKPSCSAWRPMLPDADNVAKAVMDAGNGVLWLDDRQVVELVVRKREASQGEGGRVRIRVAEVEGSG